jgi:hypothetical protein
MKSKTNTNPLLSFRVKQNPKKEIPNRDCEILTKDNNDLNKLNALSTMITETREQIDTSEISG